MGKAALCIKMLQELNTGRLYKISELADILHTNPRNVIEYKEELNSLNDDIDDPSSFLVETVPGRYGGYRLNGSAVVPTIKLNKDERNSLLKAIAFLRARNDFPEALDFSNAIKKCLSRLEIEGRSFEDTLVIDRYPLAMSSDDINTRYKCFDEAIKKREIINIDFLSNDNVVRNRNIHPYKLYMYNNAWFLLCYCELAKDYRYFKLCRIKTFQKTSRKFSRDIFFNEKDFFDKFGMTANTEDFHIKLHLFGAPAMYVKDYIYGKNQIITECKDGTTILELDMRYKNNIISFVLDFRGDCEILEPDWLKEEVLKAAKKIIQKVKK